MSRIFKAGGEEVLDESVLINVFAANETWVTPLTPDYDSSIKQRSNIYLVYHHHLQDKLKV